jgi:hypothetical protein
MSDTQGAGYGELCERYRIMLGDDTDFDNDGFQIKRGGLRQLLTAIQTLTAENERLTIERDDARRACKAQIAEARKAWDEYHAANARIAELEAKLARALTLVTYAEHDSDCAVNAAFTTPPDLGCTCGLRILLTELSEPKS